MRTRRRPTTALVAALAVVLAACSEGSGEPDLSRGSDTPVEIPAGPGFDGSAIRVGVLLPSTGPLAEVAAERVTGLQAYLDYVTTELGGVATKYPVVLDVRDSADVDDVPALVEELRGSTVLLAQVQGEAAVDAARSALADGGLLVPGVPRPDLAGDASVVQVGTPAALAAANARSWVLTESGVAGDAVLCSAAQQGADADGWQEGLERAAALDGLDRPLATTVALPAVPPASRGVAPQVEALQQAGCDVVFLVAGSPTAAEVLRAAEAAGLAATFVVPASATPVALADEELVAALADRLVVVGDGPTTEAPTGLRELVRIRQGYAPGQSLSGAFVDGYRQGKVVAAVLEAAVARGDLTPAGVRAAASRLRSVSFDELAPTVSYGPVERRRPSLTSSILVPAPGSPTGLRLVAPGVEAPVADDLATELANRP